MSDMTARIDRYFQGISLCKTLKDAVRLTSEFLNRPVAVIDTAMNHLGHYPDCPLGDGDFDALIATGCVPAHYAAVTRHNNAVPVPPEMLHRCVYSPANDTEMEKYRCRLSSGALHLGGMMVLGKGRPFTGEDLTAMQLAVQTLSGFLHKYAQPHYSQIVARHHIITDLLSRSPNDVLREMQESCPEFYAMEGQPMAVGFTDPHPGDYDLAPYWQHTLSAFFPGMQVIQHEGSLLFLFPLGALSYEAFLPALAAQLAHIHIELCLSDPFTSFLSFKAQVENAQKAFRLCGRAHGGVLCSVSDFRLTLMAQELSHTGSARSLCHPAALRLRTYDAQNGTRYCDVLHAYLFHFHNYSLAAKALFMHRNTLTYHLERIERLLGVDLDDPATCQELLISLMMLQSGE